ncbi:MULTISPECIES: efflux RND transporter periplasmic adaptor subunit [Pseudomonas]|uniref:efflux RND transporter periplasmic adaptor subunit n=1 Tax=Pseudomonas TaxID=286 RepID=UPI0037F1DB88
MQLKTVAPAALTLLTLASALSGCNPQQAASAKPEAQVVSVVTLKPQRLELTTDLPGRTAPLRVAEVRPQVDGIILKRLFKEGADIKAGQQLYQIDPATYQANLANAEARFEQSRSLAARYKALLSEQAVSRQAYDDARAEQLQAAAQLKTAQINLRYTKVLAPISGRIGRSAATEGALVTNGQTQALATLQQLDPIYVDVTQPYAEVLKLKRALSDGRIAKGGKNAASVNLTLQDGTRYPQQGTLEFSEVSVDQATGSVTIRAVFPNPEHLLLPGMFVHAQLQAGIAEQAILAPQIGITRDLKGTPTALVTTADNTVELRELKTGNTVGDKVIIEDGLHANDRLIVEGLQYVKPGDSIQPHDISNPSLVSQTRGSAAPAHSE